MYRQEVTVQDAIVAVSLVESSMQNSALLAGTNALHTSFPNDPNDDYKRQGLSYVFIFYSFFITLSCIILGHFVLYFFYYFCTLYGFCKMLMLFATLVHYGIPTTYVQFVLIIIVIIIS